MAEYSEKHSGSRLGFMVPLLLFVLFFVACCGVVAGVFLRSAAQTAFAERYNAGVQLCRNQAEICRADETSGDSGMQTLYFDGQYRPAEEGEAQYYLTVSRRMDASGVGRMRYETITAFTMEGERIYGLDVAVYLPEGRLTDGR